MKDTGLHEIREEFLKFFEEKKHLVMPSFSLVPKSDKSLLLVNSGMAPLKPYFTGEKIPPNRRVATCQKCIRTADIENVGKTARHATFFEMLGNFSFGDYFKVEAIEWAWEFLTDRLEIPKEDLWISVYLDDDEAFEIWNKRIGVDEDRIIRLGKEHNFWELGIGPCGPCSEVYVDRGEEFGCDDEECLPGCDCDRFIEIWNLVFTQFDKDENGEYHPLEHPNIDTGMGLERIAYIMQGASSIFDIDEIEDMMEYVESVSGKSYKSDPELDVSIRIIVDHCRAMTFLVSDGVLPSNEGRGYILRRLIRRSARHGKLLGIEGVFLNDMVERVIESWGRAYPEIRDKKEQIGKIVKAEEEQFQNTIHQGMDILEDYIKAMIDMDEGTLSGDRAFKLYDTYGFPLDLTKEILEERDLEVDEHGFNKHMQQQRERARRARLAMTDSGWEDNGYGDLLKGYETVFRGYEVDNLETRANGIVIGDKTVDSIEEGEEGFIFLMATPFYPESGGQVGDSGYIENDGFRGRVLDTQYSQDESIIHLVEVESGRLALEDRVYARVDGRRRRNIMKNHSATHLLHRALKDVLGEHVNQAGSIVLDNRLRFDFTHYEAVAAEDLKRIEELVNQRIFDALDVHVMETSFEESEKMGVIGLFEDRYREKVRIVQMGDYSKELCGGTHIDNTGNIGLFKIISESSIASGVRRIEAITGEAVYEYLNGLEGDIERIGGALKASRKDLVDRVYDMVEEFGEKHREIESLKSKMASSIADDILHTKREIHGIDLITHSVKNMSMNDLRKLGDEVRNHLGSGVLVLASAEDDRVNFIAMVTEDMVDRGLHAGKIIKEVAKVTGGSGGGRPNMAQAGGKDPSKVDEALDIVPSLIVLE
ncbi:MAG: alanine--tRNA ligase [Tissierellia bacterium]|nr:alanine--tRNA ligase [Tissierellia bacterium]